MNQGLGGNRILHDLRGESGLRRFDRDVLAQPGVTHATIMLGTNDLRNRNAQPEEEVTADQMIAGLKQMALRAEAGGIKLLGATLTPFGNETFLPGAWNPTREGHRAAVNTWIRESGAFDGPRASDGTEGPGDGPDRDRAGARRPPSRLSEGGVSARSSSCAQQAFLTARLEIEACRDPGTHAPIECADARKPHPSPDRGGEDRAGATVADSDDVGGVDGELVVAERRRRQPVSLNTAGWAVVGSGVSSAKDESICCRFQA